MKQKISKEEVRKSMPHIDFKKDVFTLSNSERVDLLEKAKEVGYRKSITSCSSLGSAFFIYLSKGM